MTFDTFKQRTATINDNLIPNYNIADIFTTNKKKNTPRSIKFIDPKLICVVRVNLSAILPEYTFNYILYYISEHVQ